MVKVSVILATYNCGPYLKKSIHSILSQSIEELELIICDDASTDNTKEILKSFEHDQRVVILRNTENLYAAAARNKCINKSMGKYIAIQDADDYSSINRLEKQIEFLEKNSEIDFVGTGMFNFDEEKILKMGLKPERPNKESFLFSTPFAHATLLFRREAILEVKGYRVKKETKRVEDYDLMMRLYSRGYKGYNLQEPLYYYRTDDKTYDRRKYKYRIDEALIRYEGFKSLELLPKGLPYIFKPLVVGLLPKKILKIRSFKINK